MRYLYEGAGRGTWAYEHALGAGGVGVPDIVPSLGVESSVVPVAWVKSCFLGPGEGER